MSARTPEEDDARLWRAVAVFRVVSLIYAVLLYTRVQDVYAHPRSAWAVLGAMAVWTLVMSLRERPGLALRIADLVIAVLAVLSTGLTDDPARIAAGEATLPSIWVASAVLGWAVAGGWVAGLFAAVVVSTAGLVVVDGRLSASTVNNIVLIVLAGAIVGYAVELFRRGRRELALAVGVEAATRERERLARDIHDSVLQVLAYIQRRGTQLGGEAAELGRLAGEQEARLRALVSAGPPPSAAGGEVDIRSALTALSRAGVTLVAPADPVLLPAASAAVVVAAAREALSNVTRHAGPGAKAWILVEDEDGVVTVTLRDDGAGFEAGRLAAAASEGRLGVASSIIGRIEEIGGRACVTSRPGDGTEVEITVSRDPAAGQLATKGRTG